MKTITTFEDLKKTFGTATVDGKTYTLIQQAYLDNRITRFSNTVCYFAHAVAEQDEVDEMGYVPKYMLIWDLGDDEDFDKANEHPEDDVDWEHPDDVKELDDGVDLSDMRIYDFDEFIVNIQR